MKQKKLNEDILRKSGYDYRNEYEKFSNSLSRLNKEIKERLIFLCNEFPNIQIDDMSTKEIGEFLIDHNLGSPHKEISLIILIENWIREHNTQYSQGKLNL